ncbi:hypothetical protein AAHA92_03486 [Salvia divinorum]|uniref:S-protein homolog n=1 Tax=Salvia divinorum TaxID=28513 RepID=A0ABD1IK02_SALDI
MLLVLTFSIALIRFGSSLSLYDYGIGISNASYYTSLVVQCTTNDKPMGAMTINTRSQQDFKCPWLVGERSLATCDLTMGTLRGRFDFFDSNRDLKRCKDKYCLWIVHESGLYMRIDDRDVLQYRWP